MWQAEQSENLFAAMAQSIQASKLRWRLLDASLKPLTIEEAFYMATKGGGAFFGKVGSFEPGYEFDAVVCDEQPSGTSPAAYCKAEAGAYHLSGD